MAITEKLPKVCGMLGSAQAGERASAAAFADKMLRDAGLTWEQALAGQQARRPEPEPEPERKPQGHTSGRSTRSSSTCAWRQAGLAPGNASS